MKDYHHKNIYCCRTEKVYLRLSFTHDWMVVDFFGRHKKYDRYKLKAQRAELINTFIYLPIRLIAAAILCLVPYIGLILNTIQW